MTTKHNLTDLPSHNTVVSLEGTRLKRLKLSPFVTKDSPIHGVSFNEY